MDCTGPTPASRRAGLAVVVFVVPIALAAVGRWEPPLPVSTAPQEIDLAITAVPRVEPGTIVVDRAPEGWTHLVFKSQPRVGDEYADQVSATVRHMCSLLFTCMLARVEAVPTNPAVVYRLDEVAVGVGAQVDDRPTVVSGPTQQGLGASLNLVDRGVLAGGERELDRMRCIARSPSIMIIDAPTYMLHEGVHSKTTIRYAVLVDRNTGRLAVLVWPLAEDRTPGSGLRGPLELIEPNRVRECPLHVKPEEFVFGLPVQEKSFAMTGLPPGLMSIAPRGELLELVTASPPIAREQVVRLEELLWERLR